MERYHGVVVSGTNGKTTTVALLGKILEKEGWDPLVVVGGKIPGWQKNIRIPITSGAGEGRDFPYNIMVAEGCEYRRHMQKLRPTVIVLTNLEEDHLDYFRDISDVKDAFKEYIAALPEENGILIYNADDENVRTVADSLEKSKIRKISYSLESEADAQASGIMYALDGQVFRVQWEGINLGVFSLQLPGRFNVYNAVAAGTAALSLGVQPNSIRVAFEEFSGSWRRFEKVGMIDEKIIISDYAHHPTAVKGTIKAANEFYPGKKILAVFEPHQRNRTEHFLEDFAGSFNGVDTVVVSEIYDVAGRDASTSGVSSRDLVEAIKKKNGSPPVGYAGSLEEAEKRIRELMDPFDIILIMGAGDIYKIAEKLAGTRAKL